MTRLVILNQGGGSMFRGFVEEAGRSGVAVDYITADPAPVAGGVTVHLLAGPGTRSLPRKALRWLIFTLRSALLAARSPRSAGLLIVTNPPLAPLVGLLLKRLQRRRYVLLYYDLYPRVVEAAWGLGPGSLISRGFNALNRAAVPRADAVVTIAPGMAVELGRHLPDEKARSRIMVVPTWVDTGWICPKPKSENAFARRHGQAEKLTVLYAGNLGTVHDLSVVPHLAEAFREDPGLHFLIVGEGASLPGLERAVSAKGLKNVTFLPPQPEADLPDLLATGDISLVALAAGAEGASMPSKTYYAMAAGSAILGLSRPGSDLARVIESFDCGVNADPADRNAAVAALRGLVADGDRLRQSRANARHAAEKEFSSDVCVPRLLDLVEKALA